MSYTIDFVNNKLYGADDINAIRSTIMTEGIIKKGDNDCLASLLADGIHISAGEALFNDGCRIVVSESEIIPYSGEDCYVYFDRNYYAEPKADKGDKLPENCIPLAQITAGQVKDLRDFATLKIPTMATNRYMSKALDLDFSQVRVGQVTRSLTFEDRTDIKYMTYSHQYGKYRTRLFYDFEKGEVFGFTDDDYIINSTFVTAFYSLDFGMEVEKVGNTLHFHLNSSTISNLGTATITVM